MRNKQEKVRRDLNFEDVLTRNALLRTETLKTIDSLPSLMSRSNRQKPQAPNPPPQSLLKPVQNPNSFFNNKSHGQLSVLETQHGHAKYTSDCQQVYSHIGAVWFGSARRASLVPPDSCCRALKIVRRMSDRT